MTTILLVSLKKALLAVLLSLESLFEDSEGYQYIRQNENFRRARLSSENIKEASELTQISFPDPVWCPSWTLLAEMPE